jgi:membrane-bound ClpP family serine protease
MESILANPVLSIAVLSGVALALLFAEMLLPTHGVLGGLGLLCLAGAVVLCYRIDGWLGLGAILALAVASPFAAAAAVKIWPRTPVGKRMMLQPIDSPLTPVPVNVGDRGTALSELRPMGMVTFGEQRVEAQSERNMLPRGTTVVVVSTVGGRVIVRAEDATV